MTPHIAAWLQGQIDAIRKLNESVTRTANLHCPAAGQELREVAFACNRARMAIEDAEKSNPIEKGA